MEIREGKCVSVRRLTYLEKEDEYKAVSYIFRTTNPEWQLLHEEIWRANQILKGLEYASTQVGYVEIYNDIMGDLLGAINGMVGASHALEGEVQDLKQLEIESLKSLVEQRKRFYQHRQELIGQYDYSRKVTDRILFDEGDWEIEYTTERVRIEEVLDDACE
ncbi:hypothetical protein C5Y96_11030 [Blastopirellula marina]|uniref:Uncharacterized protein n=1 Tax=Blastopirellula marina TaxID=124 RepID=A0A2S8FNE9_9BACT|nr:MULTISPECIES: hypothetical protein [Pirellulaceae]PQO33374.1 hypothetical protein C5Y96_11030 [Blastopirellula marina]RCS52463.1 hypothetical protein DTL36_11040 [Bremerella cremea]